MTERLIVSAQFVLRPYRTADIESAIALWQRAWQAAMPEIDFSARIPWWRRRWTQELVPNNSIAIAACGKDMAGYVVIDAATGWLDQIAVEPALWGSGIAEALMAEAKRIAPQGVRLDVNQSNRRAVRFYERMGFVRGGGGTNAISGAPTWIYAWTP
jgi:putative acetyltransferase